MIHLAQIRHLAIATAATTALAFGTAQAQTATPSAGAPQPAAAAPAPLLNIGEIYQRMVDAGYQDIREIEFDDGRYEVKARDAEGQRVKLYVSARSGEIEHSRFDR